VTIFDHVNVEMHEYKIVKAPGTLKTLGLGPCIGVGIIHADHGFLMHSPDGIMESETVTDPFFVQVKARIPSSCRLAIKPVVAGGCLSLLIGEAEDEETAEEISASRNRILEKIVDAGFATPFIRWAEAHEIQSLLVYPKEQVIFLETIDERNLSLPPRLEPFR
jgi:hypothetical protein